MDYILSQFSVPIMLRPLLIVAVIVVARVVRGVMRRIVVTIWCGILRAMIDHKQAAPLKNHQYDTEEE